AWGGIEFPWVSRDSLGLVTMTAALIALFIWRESRAPEPLIRLPLFRNRVFARGVAVGGMMTFAMLGSTVFLPLYFQLVLGMAPAVAGAMMLPQVVGMLLTSVIGGRIVAKMGRNKPFLLAGLGLEAVALASLAAFAFFGAPATIFLISMAALGLGMGMGMPNLTTAVQNAVVHRLQALSHFTAAQQAAVGTAYRTALTGCFLLSGVVMTLAFFLVLGLPEITLRSEI